MKKLFTFVLITVLFCGSEIFAQMDFAFGVRPGIGLNGAYFGVEINNQIVPYVGFDYFGANGTLKETGERFDYNLTQLVKYSNSDEASVSIYNIAVGAKIFFMNIKEIKPYLTGTFFKPFFSVEVKEDGKTNKEVNDYLENLSLWGFSFGFGTEYFFSENFSIGGEFGARLFFGNYEMNEKRDVYIYGSGGSSIVETDHTYEADLNIQLTYSVISLNYYF